MNRGVSVRLVGFLLVLGVICQVARGVDGARQAVAPQGPRYELRLNLKEFSVLNSAARLGVGKYGGSANFDVTLARGSNSDVVWTVRIRDPKLIEVMEYWMAEKTAELVNLLDFEQLDASSKAALQTVKSVKAKIAQARANPIWDLVKVAGVVVDDNGEWFVDAESGKYKITGSKLEDVKASKGNRVIAMGFIKVEGQIEVVRFLEAKANTLEVFVMSLCPFSKRAECSIITFLRDCAAENAPTLEIHYIFYKKEYGADTVFTALHGEKEVKENLVQMVVRNNWPEFYHEYLLQRSDSNSPWAELVRAIGMPPEDVDLIQEQIEAERNALIEQEYGYVAGFHQIYDGSPTYVWEGQRVGDITELESFNGLDFSAGACSKNGQK